MHAKKDGENFTSAAPNVLYGDKEPRVSVFDRISQPHDHRAESLVYGGVSILPRPQVGSQADVSMKDSSYAAKLKSSNNLEGNALTFFSLSDKSMTRISLPIELTKSATNVNQYTLYGYFLGGRLYFPTVHRIVKNL